MHRTIHAVRSAAAVLAVVGLASASSVAQTPYLVKNINTVTDPALSSSSPTGFVRVGASTFFVSSGGGKGSELWITDGTPAGTRLVKDINPGSGNGASGQLLPFNGGVLFAGTDDNGSELWFSDGTTAGTVLLKDISPGTGASSPNTFVDMGSYALFTANNGTTNGNELWRTDGTAAGTFMVKDIFPGASASSPAGTRRIGGTAYFRAQGALESGGTNFELWKSDGTEAGTVLVKDIRVATSSSTGSSSPDGFTEYNGFVYFAANDGSTAGRNGIELWRTDGTTAGTTLVQDINVGTTSGMPNNPSFVVLNNRLYFFASAAATGFELYAYDAASGVQLVADVNPGTLQSNPTELTAFGNLLAFKTGFIPAGSTLVGAFLVISDGTTAGTQRLEPVPGGFETINGPLVAHQGRLFFAADDLINGTGTSVAELWSSDGTTAGTQLVADLGPAGASSTPQGIFSDGAQVLFSATTPEVGRELWTSDGTAAGTVLFKDLNTGDFSGSGIASMAALNGRLIFSASDGVNGKELWTSDGTEAGTLLLKDIGPGASGSDPADPGTTFPDGFFPFGGRLFFNALQQNVTGIELWSTDGTEIGTTLLKDINTVDQTDFAPEPTGFTVLNSQLLFRARQPLAQGGAGSELWTSDGTTDGTVLLADIRVGGTTDALASSTPQAITFFDRAGTDPDWIVFSATGTTTQGNELWRSDGTAAGTLIIRDVNTAANGNSNPTNISSIGGRLFFSASLSTGGQELWTSDGTSAGTVQIADLNTQFATASSNPGPFYEINGRVIFQAAAGNTTTNPLIPAVGAELWSTNLTGGDLTLVKDIRSGTLGSLPASFVRLGDHYYFTADEGTTPATATGRELWRTDGTPAGTTLFADINRGTGSSSPSGLTVIDGFLYFAASDGTVQGGVEAYRTDGLTPPVRIADINPDGSSSPSLFTKVGTRIFFTASGGAAGAELWAIDLAPAAVVCCRGVTCAVVAAAGDCTAPAGVGARVLGSAQTSCTGQSALNEGCCYADFNKSGEKDVADIFAFLSAWFANSPFSDVGGDGTGTRDVSDIFQFLSAWFAGCS